MDLKAHPLGYPQSANYDQVSYHISLDNYYPFRV